MQKLECYPTQKGNSQKVRTNHRTQTQNTTVSANLRDNLWQSQKKVRHDARPVAKITKKTKKHQIACQ